VTIFRPALGFLTCRPPARPSTVNGVSPQLPPERDLAYEARTDFDASDAHEPGRPSHGRTARCLRAAPYLVAGQTELKREDGWNCRKPTLTRLQTTACCESAAPRRRSTATDSAIFSATTRASRVDPAPPAGGSASAPLGGLGSGPAGQSGAPAPIHTTAATAAPTPNVKQQDAGIERNVIRNRYRWRPFSQVRALQRPSTEDEPREAADTPFASSVASPRQAAGVRAQRLAPSAERKAISRCLSTARARPARLLDVHATR